MELNVKAWAVTGGLLWGLYVGAASLMAMNNLEFFWFSNQAFSLLSSLYPGIGASVTGALLGLVYGAICGAICFGLFSWVHNKVLGWFQ